LLRWHFSQAECFNALMLH